MMLRNHPLALGRRRLLGGCLAAAAALPLAAVFPGPAAAAWTPSIFNSTEKPKKGLKPFPKWRGALDKFYEERRDEAGTCADLSFNRCHYREWFGEMERLRGQNLKTQLKNINRFMNNHKYIVDSINWGIKDYWASPGEFFQRNGDCEDYAIAKFLSLRAMEVEADELRLYIVDDLNLRVGHAILAVYAGRKVFILDNQLSIVVQAKRIRHYKPIYSLNEDGWWRHRVA